jgi:ribosomal-protein-alanine N-acetyltransferase
VAGYSVLIFAADEAELANLAVAAAERRLGIGRILLDDVIAEAGTRGANRIYLEVRESNAAARALYSQAGFREMGRRRRYYSAPVEDAVIMVKALDL